MTGPGAYVAIAALAIVVLVVALKSRGMNPGLTITSQLLVVIAAVTLVDPLVGKAIVALGIAYYTGFFMGRAFEQEKSKPKPAVPPRRR